MLCLGLDQHLSASGAVCETCKYVRPHLGCCDASGTIVGTAEGLATSSNEIAEACECFLFFFFFLKSLSTALIPFAVCVYSE